MGRLCTVTNHLESHDVEPSREEVHGQHMDAVTAEHPHMDDPRFLSITNQMNNCLLRFTAFALRTRAGRRGCAVQISILPCTVLLPGITVGRLDGASCPRLMPHGCASRPQHHPLPSVR